MQADFDNPADSTTLAATSGGQSVAVSTLLRKLTAIVAAEGDTKLVAELLHCSEAEILEQWLVNSSQAVPLIKAQMLLNVVKLMGELRLKLLDSMDRMSPMESIKLFQLLLESVNLIGTPVLLTQNNLNLNGMDEGDVLARLAQRMGVQADA